MDQPMLKKTTRSAIRKGSSQRSGLVRGVVPAVSWPTSSKRTVDNVVEASQPRLSRESVAYSPDRNSEKLWTKIHIQPVGNKPQPQSGKYEHELLDRDARTTKCYGFDRPFRGAGNPPFPTNKAVFVALGNRKLN